VTLQAPRQQNSSSKGDTQAPGRKYSGSQKEILRFLDLEAEAK